LIKPPSGPHPKFKFEVDGHRVTAMQSEVQKSLDLAAAACGACLLLDYDDKDVPKARSLGEAIEHLITGGPAVDPSKLNRVVFCPSCFEISRQALLDTVGILDDLKKYLQPMKCEPVTPRKDEA
jgi:hypothetical protein